MSRNDNIIDCMVMLVLPLASVMSGCIFDHDVPCPPDAGGSFTIVNDWAEAPGADPAGMEYLFFPEEGGEPWRFDFAGRDAGQVRLPYGRYRFIMRNNDTSGVLFSGTDSYSDYEAHCRAGSLLDGLGTGYTALKPPPPVRPGLPEPVCITPDMMWGAVSDYIEVTPGGVVYRSPGDPTDPAVAGSMPSDTLLCRPCRLTARYEWKITDVANLPGARRMCAVISGMSNSLNFASGITGPEAYLLPLAARRMPGGVIGSQFFTYGYARGKARQWLALYVWMSDGEKLCYQFDVSDQVREAPDPFNVSICIRGLELPDKPGVDSGGMDAGVDGWQTVIIELGG